MRISIVRCAACILMITAANACSDPSAPPESPRIEDGQAVVENRVRIGENNWIVEFGDGSAIAEAGSVESIEIVNETDVDHNVEGAGINNVSFITVVECTGLLKAGESCTVRGQYRSQTVREANLEVAVSKQNGQEGPITERISVPLEASSTPSNKTFSPTLAARSESSTPAQSPSHSPSLGTTTSTPQDSAPTSSPVQIPSVTPTRSN